MSNLLRKTKLLLACTLISLGCAKVAHKSSSNRKSAGKESDSGKKPPNGENGQNLVCSAKGGQTYTGFGGIELTAGRVQEISGEGDRARVKSFSALKGEFQRVFTITPTSLASNGDSFDDPPKRWYIEPSVTGTNLFTLYRAAYEAALTYVDLNPDNLDGLGAQGLMMPPNETTAQNICNFVSIRAWHRAPSQEEIAGCQKIALVETQEEPSIKNRWAYAIATILAASDFISY